MSVRLILLSAVLLSGCGSYCHKNSVRYESADRSRVVSVDRADECMGATTGFITDVILSEQIDGSKPTERVIFTGRGFIRVSVHWAGLDQLEITYRRSKQASSRVVQQVSKTDHTIIAYREEWD